MERCERRNAELSSRVVRCQFDKGHPGDHCAVVGGKIRRWPDGPLQDGLDDGVPLPRDIQTGRKRLTSVDIRLGDVVEVEGPPLYQRRFVQVTHPQTVEDYARGVLMDSVKAVYREVWRR